MCTSILAITAIQGSGKGTGGWMPVDQVVLAYDHPFHTDVEHAVTLDFVNDRSTERSRVALELTRESARQLAEHLLSILADVEAYETR